MSKRTQAAVELALVFAFAFLFFSFFIVAVYEQFYDMQRKSSILGLEDLARYLEEEINFAIKAHPGYSREIMLPFKLGRSEYEVNLDTAENASMISVFFPYSDLSAATVAFYYNVSGEIKPGANFIYKGDNFVLISQEV